ncbi:carbohydrate ABC transporter permease [Fictibacillus phosphorivorans]|uniref:carbohydrate ABC transporter permease n=1 Tax=Fictibacillus phosphorivorans TaxID=1221500 RepID=UPI00203AC010|nr:sugar ABC transporter permease [Fictibacillus phosphorivorans]MCM3717738.1 sugar ABC transporter permease [Fictibacillus phosphorivorans]MCM3775638.1 sugar ABC transporter permease [Fictibacillus phosphorivorans]
MYKGASHKIWSVLMVSPFVILFLLFWALPLALGVWVSLHNWNISSGNLGFVSLDNYKSILTPGTLYYDLFMKGLKNTLYFVVISVPPLVLISLGLALIIDNLPRKLKPIYRTIFFISYSISVTAVSAIFLWLFNGNGGYFNNVLESIGVIREPINWLGEQPYAWLTILITTIWWTIGFNMMLFINALDEVDAALYEAADLDGAGAFSKFISVTWPQIRNVAFFIIIMTVIASFNLYGQTKLITGGGPEQSTNSLIMNIQTSVFGMNQLGIGSAMAIIMGLIMMVIIVLQYWLSYRNKE